MKCFSFIAILIAVGCGNYSNGDFEFQLALPEKDELISKLNTQRISLDSAEYYKLTRDVVGVVNFFVDVFIGFVDYVRSLPPTVRAINVCIWGPFPNQDDRAFENQMVMLREVGADGQVRFLYRIDYRRAGVKDVPWTALLTGSIFSVGVRRGRGEMFFDLTNVRCDGYSTRGFEKLVSFTIKYNRVAYFLIVDVIVDHLAESGEFDANYQYLENDDSSGEMFFLVIDRAGLWVQAWQIHSRWNNKGEGCGDAKVVQGIPELLNKGGIDCWGIDTRATYVCRDWEPLPMNRIKGDSTTCVFQDPPF